MKITGAWMYGSMFASNGLQVNLSMGARCQPQPNCGPVCTVDVTHVAPIFYPEGRTEEDYHVEWCQREADETHPGLVKFAFGFRGDAWEVFADHSQLQSHVVKRAGL